ncbi:MAG: hypothetical protein Q4C96_09770 [Planctomycetia bacterium]|nr:hypothetical protein [Planctomycetia bacterium]
MKGMRNATIISECPDYISCVTTADRRMKLKVAFQAYTGSTLNFRFVRLFKQAFSAKAKICRESGNLWCIGYESGAFRE